MPETDIPVDVEETAGQLDDKAGKKQEFVARVTALAWNLARNLKRGDIKAIMAAESDLQMLVDLVHLRTVSELLALKRPLKEALVRGQIMRAKLLEAEGGLWTVEEVGQHLRLSRQAVDKRRKGNRLLGIDIGRRGYFYPAWQFLETGLLPGLERTLKELKEKSPWGKLTFFLNGSRYLHGRSPLEELRAGNEDVVRRAARAYRKHGAA